jgi:hypothetical protein
MTAAARGPALLLLAAISLASPGCGERVLLGSDDCQGQTCGTPCTLAACVPDASTCNGACDLGGACVPTTPTLCAPPPPPPLPTCPGVPCGMPCPPCPPANPACVDAGPLACDGMGHCIFTPPMCMPPPFDPCAGRPCKALCNPCNPAEHDGGCPPPPMAMACDPMGMCVNAMMTGCPGP